MSGCVDCRESAAGVCTWHNGWKAGRLATLDAARAPLDVERLAREALRLRGVMESKNKAAILDHIDTLEDYARAALATPEETPWHNDAEFHKAALDSIATPEETP